jgi:hypothetical protein
MSKNKQSRNLKENPTEFAEGSVSALRKYRQQYNKAANMFCLAFSVIRN